MVVGLRQGVVSVTTDVEQCPSRLVSEVDMPPGLLFGEGSGLLLFLGKEGSPGAGNEVPSVNVVDNVFIILSLAKKSLGAYPADESGLWTPPDY